MEEFIYSHLQKARRHKGGYIARCPICGDSAKNANKRRLHVDYYPKYDEWVYKCYNGDCPQPSGNIQSLYSYVMGCTWKEADNALSDKKYDSMKIKKRLDKKTEYVDEVDAEGGIDLSLDDCYTINSAPEDTLGKRYVQKLKGFVVDRMIPLRYKPMIAFRKKYQGRLIIPVFERNKLVFFQGRSAFDFIQPKYLNPDVAKENIVLNIDDFDFSKPVVICEGLIDAMSVEGNQGTACLGSGISDNTLAKIYDRYALAQIIVALDNPLIDDSGHKNYKKLMEESIYGKKLKYFFMPGTEYKDLNDVRRKKGNRFNVLQFVEENSYTHFKASMKLSKSI